MTYHSLYESAGYTGIFIDVIEEWSQFFSSCNWYTFRPILIEFEDDRILGGVEFTLVVLGLGFRVRWNYSETNESKEILERVKQLDSDFRN